MDSLLIQLRQLKLAAMASALEQQRLAPHTYAELSFDERLGLLVEQEHLARDNTRLQRLRKQANLRLKATPEGLRYPAKRGLRAEQITPLMQGHHLTYHQNILITGPTGSGKTYLACALGEQACRQNKRVLYYRLGRLLESLKMVTVHPSPIDSRM